VLFHVYGEPAGQTVLDRWSARMFFWHTMLAQQGYIVMSVDNRGTPAPRGRDWRKCIYRQVGIQRRQPDAVIYRPKFWRSLRNGASVTLGVSYHRNTRARRLTWLSDAGSDGSSEVSKEA